jgi:hypothetical protein
MDPENNTDNEKDKKDKIDRKEKVICDICGAQYMRCNRSHHIKSKKHLNKIKDEKIEQLSSVENLDKVNLKKCMENKLKKTLEKDLKKTLENNLKKTIKNNVDAIMKSVIKDTKKIK